MLSQPFKTAISEKFIYSRTVWQRHIGEYSTKVKVKVNQLKAIKDLGMVTWCYVSTNLGI